MAEKADEILALVDVVGRESYQAGWWATAPHMSTARDGCTERAQKARERIAEMLAHPLPTSEAPHA